MKFILFFISFFIYNTNAQSAQYVDMGAEILEHSNQKYLAVSFLNKEKWHTYWKNPGDAGLTMKLKFSVNNKEVKLADLPWPAPKRYIEQGSLWAFGYSGKYALFYKIPQELKGRSLKIVGEWLVCKDICIPGTRTTSLDISKNLTSKTNNIIKTAELKKMLQNLPIKTQSDIIEIFLSKGQKENQLALHYTINNYKDKFINKKASILTPYLTSPLDYKHEEVYLDTKNHTLYGRLYIDWDGEYEEPQWPLPKDGVFKKAIKTKFLLQYPNTSGPIIIQKKFNSFSLSGDKSLSETFKQLTLLEDKPQLKKQNNLLAKSFLYYLLAAFLGGLILNLMPCVLPVISLKLFGLISHSEESKSRILKHNLFYTLGVLSSFTLLAMVVLTLKTSGEKIGWGFQLQSPYFVFTMLVLIFIMSLNMFGLFEFITPGGRTLGTTKQTDGVLGDFFNGVIATVLSTPCSAPFLGTALTFAFTTNNINIFVMFLAIGIGLSFPFILTGFFPGLIRFLPKPGAWMEKFKMLLGLSLLLTSVWLHDVFSSLVDFSSYGIYFNTLFVLIFFAFFFRKYISKKISWNILFILLPFLFIAYIYNLKGFDISNTPSSQAHSKLNWKKWSIEEMNSSKLEGEYVFINFTANWCLTCKVNKKLVLETDDFSKLVKDKKIHLLEGDWTKRDDNITNFLREHNIVGVPAYFIQKPNGEVISLGETISVGKIKGIIK